MPVVIGAKDIQHASDEMLIQAIKTLPSPSVYGVIDMLVNGVKGPDFLSSVDYSPLETHIAECTKKGIIPSSADTLVYNPEIKLFIPKMNEKPPTFHFTDSKRLSVAQIDGLLNGGKIHEIDLKWEVPEGYECLRSRFLDEVLNKGYNIHHGTIWLDSRTENNYKYSNGLLELKAWQRDLNLTLRKENCEWDKKINRDLISWFEELAEKYKVKVGSRVEC